MKIIVDISIDVKGISKISHFETPNYSHLQELKNVKILHNVQSFFSCCPNNDFFFLFLTKKYIYLKKLFQSKIFYANIV